MQPTPCCFSFSFLRTTRQRWPSAICAALFAWHPLRVESVAWTAERKDVLCGFFFFLTLLFYAHYVRHSKAASYWAAIGCYALGLMAKPMIVTLPCLLILVDYWPLERWRRLNKSAAALLALEKVPFLLMAAASCVVTYEAQFAGGSVMERSFTLPLRIANSCVGYARYLKAIFLPIDLCVFYPLPSPTWPIWEITCSGVLLTLLTTLALWQARRRPYLIVGWLWFCGLLVPAIGLVQVGSQSIADRYTYLPSIGITIAICWIGAEFVHRYPLGQRKCALGIAPSSPFSQPSRWARSAIGMTITRCFSTRTTPSRTTGWRKVTLPVSWRDSRITREPKRISASQSGFTR